MTHFTTRTRIRGDNNDTYDSVILETRRISDDLFINSSTYTGILHSVNNWNLRGVDIVNFYELKRSGILLPQTNFGKYSIVGECSKKEYEVYNTPANLYTALVSGDCCSDPLWFPSGDDISDAYSPYFTEKYVTKAAAKIYTSGHDTLTFLAELSQVHRMFLDVGKNIFKTLTSLPKGKSAREISCRWLEGRYGWRTLMYDLEDLNKAVTKLNARQKRTRYSERSGDFFTVTREDSGYTVISPNQTHHWAWSEMAEVGVRGSVVADIEIPEFQFNPVLTGWEVIPFSFVIDWFIDIGKSIAAAFLVLKSKNYSASAGIQVKGTRNYYMYSTFTSPLSGVSTEECSVDFVWQVRHPVTIPLIPSINVNLNWQKMLDLLALIVQRK